MFEQKNQYQPLAARMRPTKLSEYVGQQHLLGEGMPLRTAIENDNLHSMVLWGPPGSGKTSLAELIAHHSQSNFERVSAVLSGVKDIRTAIEKAKQSQTQGKSTVLFVDEVHRFNKSQQDAFLPFVENGTIVFVGATTENPSFELNNALLSRTRVYILKKLDVEDLKKLIISSCEDGDRGIGDVEVKFAGDSLNQLAKAADGDARRCLNLFEIALDLTPAISGIKCIDSEIMKQVLASSYRQFDKGGDAFYDQVSALHKSVRGSDPDAALYWFARLLDAGCDPLYIARRLVRIASEDIGNADPKALQIALTSWESQKRLGSPEGELALAQALIYLSVAPKSNAVYKAFKQVMLDVKSQASYPVPLHLKNAPTKLMSDLGCGKAYRYAHDESHGYAAGENYFPEERKKSQYYHPVDRGLETKIQSKLKYLRQLDEEYRSSQEYE